MNTAISSTSRLLTVAKDIKLSHSVFALPFAVLATFLADAYDQSLPGIALAIIILCMFLARTMAMTANRWADWKFDRDNPRTQNRAIPSGRLSPKYMLTVTIACAIAFIAATSLFWVIDYNYWPLVFSPLVIIWLAGYSFTKRFTWLCHLFLGVALALSPIAATVAINPAYLQKPTVWLLALMVACWVAGFDIIYALQDVQFDRDTKLLSMPSSLGVAPALWISRLLHFIAVVALITIIITSELLGSLFTIGVAITTTLLITEHTIIYRSRTNHINMAFFTINGIISLILGFLGILDVGMYLFP